MNTKQRLDQVRILYRVGDPTQLGHSDRTQIKRHSLAWFRKQFGLRPTGGFKRWSYAVTNDCMWIVERLNAHQT